MIFDTETAKKIAKALLEIKAIKLEPDNPFTWASGWQSPIYCDNRIILSHPEIRRMVSVQIGEHIVNKYGKPDVIAGVATGAIGVGILVAEYLNLPFVYVRPEAKKHGRQNQIEGQLKPGKSVVVVEDLISTGKSSLNAVKALKNVEANVLGMVAIFSYGFEVADQNFKDEGLSLNTLSNYENLRDGTSGGEIKRDFHLPQARNFLSISPQAKV